MNLAWDFEKGDNNVIIAIIDSGINLPHQDLNDGNHIVAPRCTINQNDRPIDRFCKYRVSTGNYSLGHGTKVSGITSAITNNNKGVSGIDWYAHLMPINAATLKYNPVLSIYYWKFETLYLNRALNWAITHYADVINMSVAGDHASDSLRDHCYYAWDAGCLLVAAAGNEFSNEKLYPAGFTTVMAISAIDKAADYVSVAHHGWGTSFGAHIELCAPGVDIKTTTVPNDEDEDGFRIISGTTQYPNLNGLNDIPRQRALTRSMVLPPPRPSFPGSLHCYGRKTPPGPTNR